MTERLTIEGKYVDEDGNSKYVLRTRDGERVEGVRFALDQRLTIQAQSPEERNLYLCLSCQSGCPYTCVHCATGLLRFGRNLSAVEMVDEAILMADGAAFDPLFLGMGEPFLNLEEILRSIGMMIDAGVVRSMDTALVGTSGVSRAWRQLETLLRRPRICVSIHGVPDVVRVRVIPHTKSYGLVSLERDLRSYQDKTGDQVTLNYTPLRGINDRDEDFEAFARWATTFDAITRIIPYNHFDGGHCAPASTERLEVFFRILRQHNIEFIYRPSAARRVLGGCGQLGLLSGPSMLKRDVGVH
jgi:23S rRNA (adenine2503-C2)-methyltransferase